MIGSIVKVVVNILVCNTVYVFCFKLCGCVTVTTCTIVVGIACSYWLCNLIISTLTSLDTICNSSPENI